MKQPNINITIHLDTPSRKSSSKTRKVHGDPMSVNERLRDAMDAIHSGEDSEKDWLMLVKLNNKLAQSYRLSKLNKKCTCILENLQRTLSDYPGSTKFDIDWIPSLMNKPKEDTNA